MKTDFIEENGAYAFDCSTAVWATDQMHHDYQTAKIHIKDTDLLIENDTNILMVEYKNANLAGVAKPDTFEPESDKKVSDVFHKFYDSLPYLYLLDKDKPVQFIYVLEYPNGDIVTRKRLRNRLMNELPFELQKKIGHGKKLIDKVDVVSIQEWNDHEIYGKYPVKPVHKEM
jgi:hypothetical protein